jgi:hypothetical protein
LDRPQTGCNENPKQNRIKRKQTKKTKNTTMNCQATDRSSHPREQSAPCGQSRKLLDLEGQHL